MNEREMFLAQLEALYDTIDHIPSLNGSAALLAAIGAAIAHSDEAVEAMIDAIVPIIAQLTLAVILDNAHNN